MKVGVQLGQLPGATVSEKVKWANDHGVEGVELSFSGGATQLRRTAQEINGKLKISSVCGNGNPAGERSFDFLHPDPALRRASIDGSKAILEFCSEVGAVGQIVPPIFGPPVVPDLSPWKSPLEIEEELMLAAARELGQFATEHKVLFMLEPLNRYEQHYLKRQSDGIRIIKAMRSEGNNGIGLLSDFFHMHIEETDSPAAFRDAAGYTTHIHLADNTRKEPGSGDIDFVSAFKALKETSFDGYMIYECQISGDTAQDKADNLNKSLDYVRDCIARA